jgi:GTP-binding protein
MKSRVGLARFEGAAAQPGQEPPPGPPEIAVAGRSNVGKSSFINAILGRRGLARTSGTPGRTRQLNFFLVNERFRIVDLPGYGFAVGPVQERAAWGPLVETYLRERTTLRGVVVLIDVRRGLDGEEIELLGFLAEIGRPAVLVATKLDKLGRGAATTALRKLAGVAGAAVPVLGFSARTGDGRAQVWQRIAAWLDDAPTRGHNGART